MSGSDGAESVPDEFTKAVVRRMTGVRRIDFETFEPDPAMWHEVSTDSRCRSWRGVPGSEMEGSEMTLTLEQDDA